MATIGLFALFGCSGPTASSDTSVAETAYDPTDGPSDDTADESGAAGDTAPTDGEDDTSATWNLGGATLHEDTCGLQDDVSVIYTGTLSLSGSLTHDGSETSFQLTVDGYSKLTTTCALEADGTFACEPALEDGGLFVWTHSLSGSFASETSLTLDVAYLGECATDKKSCGAIASASGWNFPCEMSWTQRAEAQ